MKLLFLGNFEAPFSSENYYLKTLRSMGHDVLCKQEGRTDVNELVLSSDDIDAFFWVHTHGWNTPGIRNFLAFLKSNNIVSFAYHLDLYIGLAREKQLSTDPFFEVDHFFTVDSLMASWLDDNTRCVGHFLPAGVYEGECYLGISNIEKYPHHIIFTGSKGYHPEWPYRPQLIDWLHKTYGDKFAHYGGGGLPTVRGPELNNLYASAKIVIGDTLCKGFNYPDYSSDRLFEVCGRGGFLIYPDIKGLDSFYNVDEVVTYRFGDFGQLKATIDYFLDNDNYRREKQMRAFERTKKQHTYTHRMQEIIDVITA